MPQTPMLETIEGEPEAQVDDAAPTHAGRAFELRWRNPQRGWPDYVAALWRRRLAIVLTTVFVGLAALVYGLSKPNTYASTATLLVQRSEGSVSSVDAAASLLATGSVTPAHLMTAIDIIRSRVVLERVVDEVGHQEILDPYRSQRGDPADALDWLLEAMHDAQEEWLIGGEIDYQIATEETWKAVAATMLGRNLVVTPTTPGVTISLSYLHNSPAGAQRILGAIVEQSVRRYSEIVAPPEGKDWLDDKVGTAQADELELRAELKAFAEEHGTTDLRQEITILTTSLAKLKNEMHLARMRVKENEQVLGELRTEIAGVEPRLREVVQETHAVDPVRQTIRQRLVELRVLRASEDGGVARMSPVLAKLNQQIETLETEFRMLGEVQPNQVIAIRANPKYASLDAQIDQRELELIGLHAKIPVYEQTLADAEDFLEGRRQLQRDALRLQEKLREAAAHYKRLSELSKTYQINAELDMRGLNNLRVLEPALWPQDKVGPRRGLLMITGLLAGLALSITVLLARVRLRRSLLRHDDVVFSLGRSDVVSLPHLSPGNLRRFTEAKRRGWE